MSKNIFNKTSKILRSQNLKVIDKDTNKILVKINKKYFRPAEVDLLIGNCNKAQKKLKWKPKTSIKKLVKLMVDHDLER